MIHHTLDSMLALMDKVGTVRRADRDNATRLWIGNRIGWVCPCCGQVMIQPRGMQLDHRHNDGNVDRANGVKGVAEAAKLFSAWANVNGSTAYGRMSEQAAWDTLMVRFIPMCGGCNSAKGDRTVEELIATNRTFAESVGLEWKGW